MKQKNMDTVNPFISRPATYYGDGPFDPPSSDDDGEEADGSRHSSEHDAESVLLLNVDKSGPSSPGRAERGDQSPRRTIAVQKVRLFNGVYRGLPFLTLDPGVPLQCNTMITEVFLCPYSCYRTHFSGRPRCIHRHSCWLYVFWKIISYTGNAKDYYGRYFQWHIFCITGRSKLGTGGYVQREN